MIGVSLPFRWLLDGGEPYGDRTAMLTKLKAHGVESAEIRSVPAGTAPEKVLAAAQVLWEHGFRVTVHGAVRSMETAAADVFEPLTLMLAAAKQPSVTVTVHPINGDNAAMLTLLADHIDANRLPVIIALENNRLLPDTTEGDCAQLVLDAVREANRPCLGICFDMGHYAYYVKKNHPHNPGMLPNRTFMRRVVHTHIHALNGLRTHFPVDSHELALKENLRALEHLYFGAYNLELDPPRFAGIREAAPALLGSVDRLKESMPTLARLYDDIRKNFDGAFTGAVDAINRAEEGSAFALVHSTSYLFRTKGYRWGMDMAFRHAYTLAKTPSQAAELLRDVQLMLISHSHGDHFEERTIRALSKTDIHWIIPAFLAETAMEWGIAPEKMTVAQAGQPIQAGPLTILPFDSRHFRPAGGNGVREYGWRITAEGEPSMIFPVDVRDYRIRTMPRVAPADICFGHVWFGDNNLENTTAACEAEAEFLLRLSTGTIVLAHLYENGRTVEQMWRREHAEQLAEAIRRRSPDTQVLIPDMGESIVFGV